MPRGSGQFEVISPYQPTGDQPQAIEQLSRDLKAAKEAVCLLGATGTGKTFTMANVIARVQKPTIIISHNKTLAAQLYEEMRELFPHNSVNYFVSYYDYYQPEAYIPQRDIYIEKDASRNDDLDQLRLSATSNILSRRDTIVVASVSCIFGLGSPEAYGEKVLTITRGAPINRREFLLALNGMQYQRTEIEFKRGRYRVRGDVLEVWPAYEKFAVRIELFGDEIEKVELINPTSGELLAEEKQFFLFPAVHYVMPEDQLQTALSGIRKELDDRVMLLRHEGKLLEAQRLLARTKYDLEMLAEVGFCSGIENYSRHLDGRLPGEKPYTLLDYFDFAPPTGRAVGAAPPTARASDGAPSDPANGTAPSRSRAARPNFRDWLCIIDESHVTMPQIRAMFNGDRNRKLILVEHGFRLPSAMDNRPLRFEEFESIVPQVLFVSATPGPYELEKTGGEIAEQVIRPTGLIDPEIEVKPARGQVTDLVQMCKERTASGERVLVTALTKRLCEDLTTYLDEQGLRVRYLHSEIETLERMTILNELRQGEFDVLVGVNLLREGLDLPEVSMVCILDADKEGFLRSPTSLIQLMGRAARNINAKVIMYADKMTPSMQAAIDETDRRKVKQLAYNKEHGITPQTIIKAIRHGLESELKARKTAREAVREREEEFELTELVRVLEQEMLAAAEIFEFEKAAHLRDQVQALKKRITQAEAEAAKKTGAAAGENGKAAGTEASPKAKIKRSELEESLSGKAQRKAGMPGVRANRRSKRKGKTGGGESSRPFRSGDV
jgi:excinuclease ABC subunit B